LGAVASHYSGIQRRSDRNCKVEGGEDSKAQPEDSQEHPRRKKLQQSAESRKGGGRKRKSLRSPASPGARIKKPKKDSDEYSGGEGGPSRSASADDVRDVMLNESKEFLSLRRSQRLRVKKEKKKVSSEDSEEREMEESDNEMMEIKRIVSPRYICPLRPKNKNNRTQQSTTITTTIDDNNNNNSPSLSAEGKKKVKRSGRSKKVAHVS